jgi:response regulator NasT
MRTRVLLVDHDSKRSDELSRTLAREGCELAARISISDDLEEAVRACEPDIVIIETSSPSRDILEGMAHLSESNPRAIAMFVDDEDEDCIRDAVRAGVAAYVVRGLESSRVRPVVQLAIARFEEHQRVRDALEVAQQDLDDRKVIERAKEKITRNYGVDAGRAYEMLRTMSMERNLKMREIADFVLSSDAC